MSSWCLLAQTPAPRTKAVAAKTAPVSADKATFGKHISPLLKQYCSPCHGGETPVTGIRIEFANEREAQRAATEGGLWNRVVTQLSTKQMPPAFARAAPTEAERKLLVDWIGRNLETAEGSPDPGPFMVHRLNNRQYANTVRELLYLPPGYDVTADFPPDERGDGFDNNAGTLTISPLLIERYLDAAEAATVAALYLDPKAALQAKDVTLAAASKLNDPSKGFRVDFANRQEKILINMEAFAPRAFRRPVSKEEIDGLMKFAALSFAHAGESFDEATGLAIRAALMSPEFLFQMERDPHPDGTGKVFEITEYQLASRMSYFLWSTMPDDELFVAARDGKLRAELDRQITRMLQDPKSISLTKDFLGQWLEIRGMNEVTNAPKSLLASMQGETEHFFDYIVRNNRSLAEFLDSDYTFVNEELARLYGIPGITGPEFQKVAVDRSQRGGIFTQASFLTLTSKPLGDSRRTSPVLRGKWILENIFDQPIPPPPPDVPQIIFDPNKQLKGTVRQIFEQHRVDPACSVCHARMDPYGFALENYDGYGAWREQDNHQSVDSSGEINGHEFRTPAEFRAVMLSRTDDFRSALVGKVLAYALGRGLQTYDRPAIDAICRQVKAGGDRFSDVVTGVISSYPFQHARGMKGEKEQVVATTWFEPVSDTPLFTQAPLPPGQGRGRGAFGASGARRLGGFGASGGRGFGAFGGSGAQQGGAVASATLSAEPAPADGGK